MADISVIIDVLGAKDMEKAARVTQTLQNKVQSLGKQLQKGNITNRDYQRGVQQLIKKNQQHAGGYKNLQKEVQRYAFSLQRQINETKKVDASMELATQSTQQATRATQQHTATVKGNTGAMATQAMAAQRSSKSMKQFASIGLQQVGYQVSDFTVQVQGGTSALVAFGQQGSQLAGLLFLLPGMFGAIAGAVTSIAIPAFTAFGNVLFNLGGKAEEVKGAIEDLDGAFNDLDNSNVLNYFGQINSKVDNSIQRFRGLLELQQKVAQQERVEAFGKLVSNFAPSSEIAQLDVQIGRLEELAQEAGTGDNERLQNMRNTLSQLVRTRGELLKIQGDTREETAANLSQVRETLVAQGLMTPELRIQLATLADQLGLYRAASQAVEETAESAGKVSEELSRTDKMLNSIRENLDPQGFMRMHQEMSGTADDAARLANNLDTAVSNTSKMMTMLRRGFAVDPQGFMRSGQNIPGDPSETETSSTGGSGGASGPTQAEMFNRSRESLTNLIAKYDEGVAEAKKLRDAQVTVNDAVANGVITQQQGTQVMQDFIASLDQAEGPLQKIGNTMKDAFGNALMSIVDGTKSAKDAFKDMARAVLKQAYELLVIKPLMNSLFGQSGGGGIVGSFLSGLTGQANGGAWNNGVQMYANGGVVGSPTAFQHKGGLGVMGEAGPEAIMPLKRGKNGKLGVQSEGGSGDVNVTQVFNINGNGDEYILQKIKQEAPKIANYTQQQILDQRRRGGAMKSTFGG